MKYCLSILLIMCLVGCQDENTEKYQNCKIIEKVCFGKDFCPNLIIQCEDKKYFSWGVYEWSDELDNSVYEYINGSKYQLGCELNKKGGCIH